MVLPRVLQYFGAERSRDLDRPVGRETVDDDDPLDPSGEALKAALDMDLLVEGEDDDRDRQRGRSGSDGVHRLRSASSIASVAIGHGLEFAERNGRRRSAARRLEKRRDELRLSLVLPGLHDARLAARVDGQFGEVVEANDAAVGEDFQIFLRHAGIAERGIDDRADRAVGETQDRRDRVRVSGRRRSLHVGRQAAAEIGEAVDEMTDLAEDAPAALRRAGSTSRTATCPR